MMIINVCTLLLTIALVHSEDEKKWVWDSNTRSGKQEKTPSSRKLQDRYEIYESDYDEIDNQQHGFGNYRPRPGGYLERPSSQLGVGSFNQNQFGANKQRFPVQRPGGVYGQGGPPGAQFNGRPHNQISDLGPALAQAGGGGYGSPGSLGAPWGVEAGLGHGQGQPFKQFDTCKCTEKFNCRSPAVSYGHCDVAKAYCCYNKYGGLEVSAPPSRPIHSPENGILVGPGGPTGIVGRPGGHGVGTFGGPGAGFVPGGRPGRPGYNGGFGGFGGLGGGGGGGGGGYGAHNGVLVGPGGHNQRPGLIGLGPIHNPENGVLIGPGGPFDGPAGFGFGGRPPYARSAKPKDEDDRKSI